ncbi:MAG: hypothetical protein ACOH17_03070 [Cellulomonas sp.]
MPVIVVADQAVAPRGAAVAVAERQAIAEAVDATPRDSQVLLLSSDETAWRESRAVRLAYGREDIGLLRCDVPVTALFVVASALAMIPDADLGLAGAASAMVTRASSTFALLSSVGSLERPNPHLGLHAASLWPSSRFLVDWELQRISRARELPPLEGHIAVIARSANAFAGFDDAGLPAERVELQLRPGASPWKCARWVEVTTLHEWLEDIVDHVLRPEVTRAFPLCPSCGRAGWGQVCVFCQLPLIEVAVSPAVLTPGGLP